MCIHVNTHRYINIYIYIHILYIYEGYEGRRPLMQLQYRLKIAEAPNPSLKKLQRLLTLLRPPYTLRSKKTHPNILKGTPNPHQPRVFVWSPGDESDSGAGCWESAFDLLADGAPYCSMDLADLGPGWCVGPSWSGMSDFNRYLDVQLYGWI